MTNLFSIFAFVEIFQITESKIISDMITIFEFISFNSAAFTFKVTKFTILALIFSNFVSLSLDIEFEIATKESIDESDEVEVNFKNLFRKTRKRLIANARVIMSMSLESRISDVIELNNNQLTVKDMIRYLHFEHVFISTLTPNH